MAGPELPGWGGLEESLAAARAELRAAAPDSGTAAEAEAYLLRVVTSGLHDSVLRHLATAGGLSQALPTRGAPNPDYRIHHAAIDSARCYRLVGRLHESERVGIGLYSFDRNGASLLTGYAAIEPATADGEGKFALDLAADASGPGALVISPDTRLLIVRTLHRRPQARPATLELSGGPPFRDLALPPNGVEGALGQTAHGMLRSVRQFLRWSCLCAAAPNRFQLPPTDIAAEAQGDPDTVYGLGYYDLTEGQWLEVLIPAGLPGYWSLHAYNHWCEALPGAGRHDLNARPDADGRIRVRIGPAVPAELDNRVDTLGRRRGVLVFRSVAAATRAIPEATLRR